MAETRQQKIERIRREIAAGTYYTREKLELALVRMMLTPDPFPAPGEFEAPEPWQDHRR